MKGLKKWTIVALIVLIVSMLFAPAAVVHAGEEDIPRIMNIGSPIIDI